MIKLKNKKDGAIYLRIDPETEKMLEEVIKKLPELEGNKSQVIRYAIVRLHRELKK